MGEAQTSAQHKGKNIWNQTKKWNDLTSKKLSTCPQAHVKP
jgi:hypothetical protein